MGIHPAESATVQALNFQKAQDFLVFDAISSR